MADDIRADYFALSDQDDIWEKYKLTRAVKALESNGCDEAQLYCSRVVLVNEHREHIGFSPLFKKKPSFTNALVQSIAGGNTMVLNKKARQTVSQAGVANVVVHDWWLYLLITGAGGRVLYDPMPTLLYRQHSKNVIGFNQSPSARLARLAALLRCQHQIWNEKNVSALKACSQLLSDENSRLLADFEACRKASLIARLRMAMSLPLYRQTFFGMCSLYLAILLKRL
jgi:hypothetical protein